MYYIVEDDEGAWLTEKPGPNDKIVFETNSLRDAEVELARYENP